VVVTHDGYLFAWETEGEACDPVRQRNPDWPMFRHDEHNTGLLGYDGTPPRMIADLDARVAEPGQYNLHFTAPAMTANAAPSRDTTSAIPWTPRRICETRRRLPPPLSAGVDAKACDGRG